MSGMAYDKQSFLSGVAVGRNMESWPAFEASETDVFAFTVRVSAGETFSFYFNGSVAISWGDGSVTPSTGTHTYAAAGDYLVIMTGQFFGRLSFGYTPMPGAVLTPKLLLRVHTPYPRVSEQIQRPFAVELYRMFNGCENLESVPDGFLENLNESGIYVCNVESMFRRCRSLMRIPARLFNGVTFHDDPAHLTPDPEDRHLFSVFDSCETIETIPDDLFDNPTIGYFQNNARYLFRGCSNLEEIPAGLFDNLPDLKWFDHAFSQTGITEIPTGLFSPCVDATEFRYCFNYCPNLGSVPDGLFSSCPAAEDFRGIFQECDALETIYGNPFDGSNPAALTEAFYGCNSITSAVPELWNLYPNAGGRQCFFACQNASNYEDIPAGWK